MATRIAPQNATDRGWVKGQPVQFIRGHKKGPSKHRLDDLDILNRTAQCSNCGPVTIKKNGRQRSTGEQVWKCHGSLVTEHRLDRIDAERKTAWCRACREEVSVYSFKDKFLCAVSARKRDNAYREANRERVREVSARWQRDNRERLREKHRAKRYSLTTAEFRALLEAQNGVCAICGMPPSGKHREEELHVDHCHFSGVVRGLLCSSCNRGIGLFRDDAEILKKAAFYVSREHL